MSRLRPRSVRTAHAAALLPASLLALAAACGPSSAVAPELLEPTGPKDAFEGVNCSAIRPPTEPDLMAWDAGQRANLKQLGEQGVVGVRYKAEGCNVELEVLDCVGKGTPYQFSAYSATETKLARSQRDLYTELPLGAARLGGKVGGGRALRTDYMLAGVLATPVMKSFPAERLEGDCERATHVVSRLYLGGFAMAAGESESIAAEASLFGVGVSGAQDRAAERLSSEGNARACQRAQEEGTREAGCSVPLRIGLSPIAGRVAEDCPTGSSWNGSACVARQVLTEVACPPGASLRDGQCVAALNTDCPAGMSFEAGKGCVAKVVAARTSTSTSTEAKPGIAPTSTSCPPSMAALPGGSFKMGERGDMVSVQPFCMDLTEVTVADYKACTRLGKCSAAHAEVEGPGIDAALRDFVSGGCNIRHGDRDRHPINCVDWSQAEAYCKANGKRLPSEEEWEWAARGGAEGRAHPWGSAEPGSQLCWKRGVTCPVGSFPSGNSVHGVQDLSGNVWEWTARRYRDQGYVVRGGSHDTVISAWLSASFSRSFPAAKRHTDLGFRCVR